MHYKRVVEHGTTETFEQTKAKEEAINTAAFTQGEYATLCRGNTSQVMAFALSATGNPNLCFEGHIPDNKFIAFSLCIIFFQTFQHL